MCNDLNDVINYQKDLNIPEKEKAMMLIRACKNSIDKLNKKFVAHVADANSRLEQISEESKDIRQILYAQSEKLEKVQKALEESNKDATRWQLIVQICKTLFGDMKRSILTTIWIGLLMGMVHFSDIIELLRHIA